MKQSIKITMLLMSVAMLFSACKKNPDVNKSNFNFVKAEANYLGNIYRNNVNAFEAYFFDSGLGTDANGYITGSGAFLFLDMNTTKNANSIPSGTYKVNNENVNESVELTFQRGKMVLNNNNEEVPSGSYIAIVNNGKITDYLFLSSGSIIVNKMGNYSITGQVTTSDNEFYEFSFSGSIPTTDLVTPYPQTLKKGQLWYWGDIDQVGLNIYTIWLADQNINMTNMSGNGDLMRIEVYTPTSYTTSLPNGTYPVKINTVENQTVIDGFNNGTEDLGTWYYTADAFPITGGSMTVVKNAGSSYNLNFTFIDELGNTISGTYNGDLGLVNKASTSQGIKSRIQKVKNNRAVATKTDQYNIRIHRGSRINSAK